MSREPSPGRPVRPSIDARLRPLVVALAAVVLSVGSVSPAVALSPAEAVASSRAAVASAEAVASPSSIGVAAAASADAASSPSVAKAVQALPVKPKPTVTPRPRTAVAAPSFGGSNHLWIPALGINRGVSSFPCSRQQAPDNYVYRWGCAGTNNVYLLGHAYGVFKALHDAYYNGRLKVGLTAIYAAGSGTIHTYRVAWWRVVRPTTDAKWAWAPLASPGMTLQTCMGAHSEYRLMVRLVQVT